MELSAPTIEFIEEGHRYLLDGEEVDSVSKIIEKAYDFRFVDPAAMERSRDFGRKVHKTVELFEDGRLNRKSLAPELESRLVQWERFKADHGYMHDRSEIRVGSRRWSYAGTVDSTGLWLPTEDRAEEAGLVDIKTGMEYAPHKLQTAGYLIAAKEMQLLPNSTLRATVYLEDDSYAVRFYRNRADEAAFSGLAMFANWTRRYA